MLHQRQRGIRNAAYLNRDKIFAIDLVTKEEDVIDDVSDDITCQCRFSSNPVCECDCLECLDSCVSEEDVL